MRSTGHTESRYRAIAILLALGGWIACSDSSAATDSGHTGADASVADSHAADTSGGGADAQGDSAAFDGTGIADSAGHDSAAPTPDTRSDSGGCKVDCDCPQGLLCSSGSCISGIVPTYCCTKAGCPTGKACSKPDGSKSTCP